jgi:hypothetical protein
MNGKGFKSSNLAVAIATSLAVSGAVTPTLVHAKAVRDAIIGTGADAIIGTGRSKATSSSDAIIGTGKGPKHANNAIIGTGTGAIIGTGADAIIGTGADAIIGTGRSKATSSSDAIIGTGKRVVVLMGPVDSVDAAASTVSVLNRTLKMRSTQSIQDALAAGQQLSVAVTGHLTASGKVEQLKLSVLSASYVAGASKVVISGRVDRLDSALGRIQIGNVSVDVTSVVAAKPLAIGSTVLLVGTQPVRQGIVLAERLFSK